MDNSLNLIKLCVGAEKVEDLVNWQKTPRAKGPDGVPRHVTRMWPKRQEELLDGGSLYWVMKGLIRGRQAILGLEKSVGEDGITRCAIQLDPELVLTNIAPRRPFQGWRYLDGSDAPPDLITSSQTDVALPSELQLALGEIGVR